MIASAMSRRSCRAAGGLWRPSKRKPSLAYFPSTIYRLYDVCRPDEPTDFPDLFLPDADATMQRRLKDPKTMARTAPESKESGRPPLASTAEMDFFNIIVLAVGTNFGRESDHSMDVVARSALREKAPGCLSQALRQDVGPDPASLIQWALHSQWSPVSRHSAWSATYGATMDSALSSVPRAAGTNPPSGLACPHHIRHIFVARSNRCTRIAPSPW
ncbi:hypothetical protein THAOC_12227 [Thalassiosira oceanica]|uniref:Uncharacterized protein n=1 Tax=Thalassiosira oceanica TaxID=159749 RepID=K0T0J4_THAOC|nr:hypothetical protein THAOC_12227 [Thalassiosira oceanica]|eukprot:EJK66811.1 hypothetical protein THAOC_12227 [Thalassiosira oceanica]